MPTYTDKFGGSAIEPAYVSFRAVSLTANITTMWPSFATVGNQLARIMKTSATAGGFTISLPDATLSGAGQDVIFDNSGAFTFTVLDFAGNSIATLAPGQVKYLYLSDSSTQAGTWRVTVFGVGSSTLDASQLAGSGLTAIGATLNQAYPAATINANTTFVTSDRAKLYVNVGGSITGTMPLTSTVGNNWFMEVRNQGSGTMTIAATGGETVDGSATIVLQLGEACTLIAGTGSWYSVGRGRNQQFNFTQLTKAVTGGTTTLTLTEAANVVQTYTGVLLSNEVLVVPAVVQVYYIANNTTGSYTFTVQSPTPGSVLVIPTGQSAVVFCDGVNVVNASTTVSGITSLLLSAGAVGSPSLALVSANNGFFAPTSTSVAVSAGGTEVARWSAGQELAGNGTVGAPSYSFTLSATTGAYSPAANQWALAINGAQAMLVTSSGVTLANALPIGSGGTGATTAGTALAALGGQAVLVSGTNIKTVNSTTLLGAGDVAVQATLVSGTNIKTINSLSLLGSGNLVVGSLTNVTVTLTTQACAVNSAYLLTNVAATACTAPAGPADGDKFAVIPANGLVTNTLDFGVAVVKGVAPGLDVTGVLTLNPAVALTFMWSSTISKWVVV